MTSLFDGNDDILGDCGQNTSTNYTVKVGLGGNTYGQQHWKEVLADTDSIIKPEDRYKSTFKDGSLNPDSANVNIESKTNETIFSCNFNDNKSLYEYGLASLNKKWGGGTKMDNNGCVSENVFIPCSKIQVVYADVLNREPELKKVLQLEAHGDKYTGNVKGIGQQKMEYKDGFNIPTCPQKTHVNTGVRVGGVVSTIDNFGPGSYEVIARVPKTSAPTGRGYVFAMWTFHYEEHYDKKDNQFVSNSKYDDYNPKDEDEYCIINHEIDIECPANPDRYGKHYDKQQDVYTWNTMNMNTWIADNLTYDDRSWYREIVAIPKKIQNTFISENGEFHSYKFVWYVPLVETKTDVPYVDFYFDNEKIYREFCFIPSRSGKLLVGPWFGWWGFDQINNKYVADFDSVAVLVSEITIIPDHNSKIVEYPQMYDQIALYDNKEIHLSCDFGQNFTNICESCNSSESCDSKSKNSLFMWLFISLCIIIIIIVGYLKTKKRF